WENFPNVCLEAMAAGRAVIGSNAGGMSDMIEDEKHGILCNPNNSDDLAQKIIYFIENPNQRYEKGLSARKKILEAYNQKVIYDKTISFYKDIINDGNLS